MKTYPYDQEEQKAGGEDPAGKPDEHQAETFHGEAKDDQESVDDKLSDTEQKLSTSTGSAAQPSATPALGKPKSKGKQGVRKGKWTPEEERYTNKVIEVFNAGLLKLPDSDRSITLRAYLAEKLGCDPMRITKKFTGASCLGKRVYHFDYLNANQEEAERARQELQRYEDCFREKLDQLSRLRNSSSSIDVEHSRVVSTPAIDALMQRTDRMLPTWPEESGRPISAFTMPYYYPPLPPAPLAAPGYLPHCDPRMGLFMRELPPGMGKPPGVDPGLSLPTADYPSHSLPQHPPPSPLAPPSSQPRMNVDYDQPVFYPAHYPLMSAYFIPPPVFNPYDPMRAMYGARMAPPRPMAMAAPSGQRPPPGFAPYMHAYPMVKPGAMVQEGNEVLQETVESVLSAARRPPPSVSVGLSSHPLYPSVYPSSFLHVMDPSLEGEDAEPFQSFGHEEEEDRQMSKRSRPGGSSPDEGAEGKGTACTDNSTSPLPTTSDSLAVPATEC